MEKIKAMVTEIESGLFTIEVEDKVVYTADWRGTVAYLAGFFLRPRNESDIKGGR